MCSLACLLRCSAAALVSLKPDVCGVHAHMCDNVSESLMLLCCSKRRVVVAMRVWMSLRDC